MCGRFALTLSRDELQECAGTQEWVAGGEMNETHGATPDGYVPNHNIRPTTEVAVVRKLKLNELDTDSGSRGQQNFGQSSRKVLQKMRWGLVPVWAKEISNQPLFNARVESIDQKSAFRPVLEQRLTAIVITTGFYEWYREQPPPGAKRRGNATPMRITAQNSFVLKLAALYSVWRHPQSGARLFSFTILTTDASAEISWLHDRMPVLLDNEKAELWLDAKHDWRGALQAAALNNRLEFCAMSADLAEEVARGRPQPPTKRGTLAQYAQQVKQEQSSASSNQLIAPPKSAFQHIKQQRHSETGSATHERNATLALTKTKAQSGAQITLDAFLQPHSKRRKAES